MPTFRVDHRLVELDDRRVEVLDVVGEVDVASASAFQRALSEAIGSSSGDVIVNFVPCRFADTGIVKPVADAIRTLRRRGNRLGAVICTDQAVRRVLDFSGLQPQITLFDSRTAALDAFRRGGDPA